jgi:hypothetical protein
MIETAKQKDLDAASERNKMRQLEESRLKKSDSSNVFFGGLDGFAASYASPAASQSISFRVPPPSMSFGAPVPYAPPAPGSRPAMQQQPMMMQQQQRSQPSAPAPAPAPASPPANTDSSAQIVDPGIPEFQPAAAAEPSASFDFTQVPVRLDARLEQFDEEGALRPTLIKCGPQWTKKSQANLLSSPVTSSLNKDSQRTAKNDAFDLLDALSRSGVLSVECAELHVVVAATHCFDLSLIETVVQQNVNPIEKLERSNLIVASTIHDTEVGLLVKADNTARLSLTCPSLFPALPPAPALITEGVVRRS